MDEEQSRPIKLPSQKHVAPTPDTSDRPDPDFALRVKHKEVIEIKNPKEMPYLDLLNAARRGLVEGKIAVEELIRKGAVHNREQDEHGYPSPVAEIYYRAESGNTKAQIQFCEDMKDYREKALKKDEALANDRSLDTDERQLFMDMVQDGKEEVKNWEKLALSLTPLPQSPDFRQN